MHGVCLPSSIFFPSIGLEIFGGMQNSGMVSGVMMFGHSKTFLALSMDDLSPNMMSPSLKLYSVMGSGRLVLSTDTRIFSTTHMGILFGLGVEALGIWFSSVESVQTSPCSVGCIKQGLQGDSRDSLSSRL